MATKVQQFAEALARAIKAAEDRAAVTDDGGTCNMDSVLVRLPRYNADAVTAIAKAQGIHAYKREESFWDIGSLYGQANRNEQAHRAMCESLKADGYQAYMNHRMD